MLVSRATFACNSPFRMRVMSPSFSRTVWDFCFSMFRVECNSAVVKCVQESASFIPTVDVDITN